MNYSLSIKLILFFIYAWTGVFAQPANDDCAGAIVINEAGDWCSVEGSYTTIDATVSGFGASTCFGNASNDVWFKFLATASDVTILIRGDVPTASGGSLIAPEVALYTGSCGGSINQQACATAPTGQNVVSMHKGGLQLGAEYLIRVQGKNTNEGTFQLCITSYNPPVDPGQDCITASPLCDLSSFTVQQISGGGNNTSEADNTCIDIESSSTWFVWKAATSDDLTFELSPTNAPDDLDFVVFELPNGNCANKISVLCNAAGSASFPSKCMGPTGLRTSSSDAVEQAGCDGSNDGWLKPLAMEAGKTYALLVNNYSNSGSGFQIDFGGDAEIEGPEIAFETDKINDESCYGSAFTFTDKSTFNNGTIALWDWNFGIGGTPIAATGKGPHTVNYNSPGLKLVSLKITTTEGCVLTLVKQINVLPCCETVNKIEVVPNLTNLKCDGGSDGAISLNVTTNALPIAFNWGSGTSVPNQNNLEAGIHGVTITNFATCESILEFELTAPPPMVFDTIIQRPTCGGGTDGVLELVTLGGVAPYEYSFNGGVYAASNTLKNVPTGLVSVGVRDANSCTDNLSIAVSELELLLNPNVVSVDRPSCFGFSNGNITLGILNGKAPFQYDFGTGFQNSNVLENISAGTYTAEILDANLCKGSFEFDIPDHPQMTITIAATGASCFGLADGSTSVVVGGGVGDYAYLWSNNATTAVNENVVAGAYSVVATDENGCKIIEEISVVEPMEIHVFTTGIEGVICFGDKTGIVGLSAMGGTAPYLFSIDNSIFQQDTAFANVQGGWHKIFVQDMSGCVGMDSIFVPEPEELIVQAFGDATVNLGYETPLWSQVLPQGSIVEYKWFPDGESFQNPSIPNPVLRPMNSGFYYLLVTDTAGCTALDSVLVQVNDEKPVYGPNAFSPNGDGVNDFFTVFGGPAAIHLKSLRIFDRFGNMVYTKKDFPLSLESTGWDGRYKGKMMNSDTYVWMAEVEFWDGKSLVVAGDVSLVR